MKHLIDKFETTVSENNGSIMVNYRHDTLTGYCEYRIIEINNASPMVGTVKRFKQKAWLLINTDMGDVIEYIHSNSPLSDKDLQDVNKLIRDHSLLRVQSITSRK
jgi:hypothetical protein